MFQNKKLLKLSQNILLFKEFESDIVENPVEIVNKNLSVLRKQISISKVSKF